MKLKTFKKTLRRMHSVKELMLLISLSIFMPVVEANSKWEFGLGVGHLTTNAYLGSSDNISLTTPVPFIKVKTDWFDLSDGNLKMNWFEGTPFNLSFNFDVALPVDSGEVSIREDMDDLDPVLQVGPMLSYQLSTQQAVKWKLELPILYAYQLDGSDIKSTGWSVSPRVAMRYQIKNQQTPLDLEMSLGPVYGSEQLYDYYYSVEPSDVTINRAEYHAEGGYAGYRLNMSFTKRDDDLWFGLYMRYHDLTDATFSDSPLVDDKDYWLVTFAMSWIFASSN